MEKHTLGFISHYGKNKFCTHLLTITSSCFALVTVIFTYYKTAEIGFKTARGIYRIIRTSHASKQIPSGSKVRLKVSKIKLFIKNKRFFKFLRKKREAFIGYFVSCY
jgi:hypothetical protein